MMAKVMPNPVSREPVAARQSSLPRLRYSFGVLIRYLQLCVSKKEGTYTRKEEKRLFGGPGRCRGGVTLNLPKRTS